MVKLSKIFFATIFALALLFLILALINYEVKKVDERWEKSLSDSSKNITNVINVNISIQNITNIQSVQQTPASNGSNDTLEAEVTQIETIYTKDYKTFKILRIGEEASPINLFHYSTPESSNLSIDNNGTVIQFFSYDGYPNLEELKNFFISTGTMVVIGYGNEDRDFLTYVRRDTGVSIMIKFANPQDLTQ